MVHRRAVLLGVPAGLVTVVAASFGLVEADVLPGRAALNRRLGRDGPDTPLPVGEGGTVVDGSFVSAACARRTVRWRAAYPPGARTSARLPVVVALHGRGGDHRQVFDDMGIDRYLAAAVRAGVPPFAVVSVDGGDHSYWHRRADGDDRPAMIRTELLPRLARRGLRTDRLALAGWSMGGYGALLYAERHAPDVTAVAAVSPALWRAYGDSAPGAFDNEADFRRHDVFAGRTALRRVRLRVDCGDVDPFLATTRAFRAAVHPRPQGGVSEGAHDMYYWRRAMPGVLRFLGRALAHP